MKLLRAAALGLPTALALTLCAAAETAGEPVKSPPNYGLLGILVLIALFMTFVLYKALHKK